MRQRSATSETFIGPSTSGSRFSKNACTPSTTSSVDSASVRLWCRYSSASKKGMSIWRNIASLPRRIITGDFAASWEAQSATAASNSSALTTRFTIPASRACSAVMRSPSSSISFVVLRGTLR